MYAIILLQFGTKIASVLTVKHTVLGPSFPFKKLDGSPFLSEPMISLAWYEQ